jgi:hypothetical protein
MVAQATFPSAAAAQRHVNALIEEGMKGENANLWGSLRCCGYCPVVVRETEAEIAAQGRPLRAYRSAPSRNEPHRFARSLQIHPAAFDLQVGFVHPPGAIAHAHVGADPLFQFGRLSLNPAGDGGVIDLDAAVLREFEIAVTDGEHQIPSHSLALPFHPAAPDGTFGKSRPQNHLGGELPALEGLILLRLSCLSSFRHSRLLLNPARREKLRQNPDRQWWN